LQFAIFRRITLQNSSVLIANRKLEISYMLRMIFTVIALTVLTMVMCPFAILAGLMDRSGRVFSAMFWFWSRTLLSFCGARITVRGRELLGDGCYFFAGNHLSAIDIPLMAAALGGRVRFMAKHTLFHIPLFGWALAAGGMTAVDRSNPRRAVGSIDRMVRGLARRRWSMVVFPEGTRSEDGKLGPFKRGAFTVLKKSAMAVAPFRISGARDVVRRGRWRVAPGPVTVQFAAPIAAEEADRMNADELMKAVRDAIEKAELE
jgi:1-acyl-sn-glycerol-3-phosphate acyltransferase